MFGYRALRSYSRLLLATISLAGCTDSTGNAPGPPGPKGPRCVRYADGNSTAYDQDGLSWSSAYVLIQDAINAAQDAIQAQIDAEDMVNPEEEGPYCEVWVAAGTYAVYQGNQTDTIELKPGIHFYGGFSGNEEYREARDLNGAKTVLDGKGEDASVCHVVTAAGEKSSQEIIIDGFTITGGNACPGSSDRRDGHGGGLIAYGKTLVSNCVFESNLSDQGGAIKLERANKAAIINTDFFSNESRGSGGAVSTKYVDELLIKNGRFLSNRAGWNGGAVNRGARIIIADCIFHGNQSSLNPECYKDAPRPYCGGGALGTSGSNYIYRSVFYENEGGNGGAVHCSSGGSVVATASVFLSNKGSPVGGIGNDGCTVQVINSTFVGNMGSEAGSVVQWGGGRRLFGTHIVNSILWGNGLWDGELPVVLDGPEIVDWTEGTQNYLKVLYSDVEGGYPGEGNIDQDPRFEDARSGDVHLRSGSPCIDAGIGAFAPETDISGNSPRDDLGGMDTGIGPPWVDMGAYEYLPR